MAHRRVNISIDPELHDRATRLVERIPGATFSGLVQDVLRDMLPVLETVADAYEEGGEEAAGAVVEQQLGKLMLGTHQASKGGDGG